MTTPSSPLADTVKAALSCLAAGDSLTRDHARQLFQEIMAGSLAPEVLGGILMAMRARGETADEIAGAVEALRSCMRSVSHPAPDSLVDTCGTGGGSISTLNLSTAAAFVVAGAGIPVAKHGNRSFTSRSGSADVLEAMGIAVDGSLEAAERLLIEGGLAFFFAPTYHPAMRHAGPVRKTLGVATIMNLLGPLANPVSVRRQVIGVADASRAPVVASALKRLGVLHAWVVRGEIGMDEISPLGKTRIWEVRDDALHEWQLDPAEFGLEVTTLAGLEGGEPAENAARILGLFTEPAQAAPALRAAVLLNAAAAILVSGRATDFGNALAAAEASLNEGKALARVAALRLASPSISTSG